MRYRVKTVGEYARYYVEYKYRWWPFWFGFKEVIWPNGCSGPSSELIFFDSPEDAVKAFEGAMKSEENAKSRIVLEGKI